MTRPAYATSYAAALAAYVAERSERRLKAAYDLGRAAVEQGLGVLDLAAAHQDALARAARCSSDVDSVLEASGDFLIESLATFEVVQRGATDAWRAAWEERRRARLVRELSAVLADANIASAAGESVDEVAQLVAEIARELTAAAEAVVSFDRGSGGKPIRATAVEPEEETWSEILHPAGGSVEDERVRADAITVEIRSIDGTPHGQIEVVAPVAAVFRLDDHAVVRQVADLAGAWLDRTGQL